MTMSEDIIKHDDLIVYRSHIYKCRVTVTDTDATNIFASECGCLHNLSLMQKNHGWKTGCFQFTTLCEAVKAFFLPSAQMKLGIFLKNTLDLMHNLAITAGNDGGRKTMKRCQHLMTTEWKQRVGCQAQLASEQIKFNKVDILPIRRDVLKRRNHLDKEVARSVAHYEAGRGDVREAKKPLACKSTVFNKIRGWSLLNQLTKRYRRPLTSRRATALIKYPSLKKICL